MTIRRQTPPVLTQPAVRDDASDPLRKFALAAGVCLVAIRFGQLHQLLAYVTEANPKLLYFVGLPAGAGVVLSGGLRRAFHYRPALYWTAYVVWMGMAVPFSTWRGPSLGQFLAYARNEYFMLLVIAGLTVTWSECKALMYAIALGGVVSVASGKIFQDAEGTRLALDFGTIGNANDYACHLLAVLPFVLWLALRPRSVAVIRALALAIVGIGLALILRTASRGAAVGLVVAFLFFLYRASNRQRAACLVLGPILAVIAISTAPDVTLRRIGSFETDSSLDGSDAAASTKNREQLFKKSIEYTLQHPIFGVGPGQFPNYEGKHDVAIGRHGYYKATHNTFTQVSSECGIPAMIFFIAGLASSFLMLSATYRQARQRPGCEDIQNMSLCIMLAIVGFTVGITFLSFAYFFYAPAFGGLAIAVSRAGGQEFEARRAGAQGPQAPPRLPEYPRRKDPTRYTRTSAGPFTQTNQPRPR